MVINIFYSGVIDIKRHRWFNNFSWDDLMKKKIKPSYVPVVKSLGDVSNFDEYPDSGITAQDIKPSLDPFLTWWYDDDVLLLHYFISIFYLYVCFCLNLSEINEIFY